MKKVRILSNEDNHFSKGESRVKAAENEQKISDHFQTCAASHVDGQQTGHYPKFKPQALSSSALAALVTQIIVFFFNF